MTTSRESHDSAKDSYVLITRRRWDWYFLAGTIGSTIAGVIAAWKLNRWQMLGAPLFILPLWLFVRTMWPKDGRQVPTVLGTPGAAPMLAWAAFMLTLTGVLIWLDMRYFGQGFRDPLRWYHYVASALLYGLIVGGFGVIDRKWIRPNRKPKSHALHGATDIRDGPRLSNGD